MQTYYDLRDSFCDELRSLDSADLDRTVELTPLWTVADNVRHVVGILDDIVNGATDGLGTEAWTQRQVDKRQGVELEELIAEWTSYDAAMNEIVAQDSFLGVRLAGDLVIHRDDIAVTLGWRLEPARPAVALAARRYIDPVQQRCAEAGLGLDLVIDGERFDSGIEGAPMLTATALDFLRSVTGRRSRRQVALLEWSGEPDAVIDGPLAQYGAFQANDVVENR